MLIGAVTSQHSQIEKHNGLYTHEYFAFLAVETVAADDMNPLGGRIKIDADEREKYLARLPQAAGPRLSVASQLHQAESSQCLC